SSGSYYADPVTLGNNLVGFMQGGGVVVAFNFNWATDARAIQGAWLSGNYSPFNIGGGNGTSGTLGTCTNAPLCSGVNTLSTFNGSNQSLTLAPGATLAATWNDGTPLIAYKGQA